MLSGVEMSGFTRQGQRRPFQRVAGRCTFRAISVIYVGDASNKIVGIPAGDFKSRPKYLGAHKFGGHACGGEPTGKTR